VRCDGVGHTFLRTRTSLRPAGNLLTAQSQNFCDNGPVAGIIDPRQLKNGRGSLSSGSRIRGYRSEIVEWLFPQEEATLERTQNVSYISRTALAQEA
jgi:hypothetical protein